MSQYFRTPAYPDAMPVDISFVFADEKPAGKHGFLKPCGDEFRFEDGTKARFWGVNFNGGANFPEHDYSEKVARRLAQSGCNIVRFHQLDAEWDTPNIYSYTKGPRVTTTRKLDPVSMDHLDYLIHCLKEQGIYVYFDMMTYRKFKSGDDVPFAEELRDSAKPYSIFDRRLIELQKEFCDQIWNRFNKYTGLLYKDDPVFAMTEITNECDLYTNCEAPNKNINSPHYEQEFRDLYKEWLEKNGKTDDYENCDMYDKANETLGRFKLDLTLAYYNEMRDYMRSIGVKHPITGTNWAHGTPMNAVSNNEMDFMDSHHYYYDWGWGSTEKFAQNVQVNGISNIFPNLGYMNTNDRPFFVSEWDMPWPNSYRAEGPIYYAAIGALQNWTGFAIHTYAYGTKLDKMDILGKEVSSSTIGGVPYREGIFSVWNDPAKFGLFYHAALITRREDITPAKKKIGVQMTSETKILNKAFKTGLEVHNLKLIVPGGSTEGCDEIVADTDVIPAMDPENPDIIASDNGEVWRSLSGKFGAIDTERTKVIYGRLTAGRNDSMKPNPKTFVKGMSVKGGTDFGVIALSSLTDDPISKSTNMLLSTIGRARNTGAQFDGDKMIEYGEAPILSEVVRAEITIETERTDLQVWGVNAEGYYVGRLLPKFEDGKMTFTVGEHWPANYYLIVAE